MKRYKYFRLFLIVLFVNFVSIYCGESQFVWNAMLNVSSETFEQAFLPNYINFQQDVTDNELISKGCKTAIQQALYGLKSRQFWAVKLFNSWAKFPPTGTLRGTLTDFGDYDQCLSTDNVSPQYCLLDIAIPMPRPMPKSHNYFHKSKVLPEIAEEFNGLSSDHMAFLANGSFYQQLADVSSVFYYAYIQIGICLPDQCSKNDTKLILDKSIKEFGLTLQTLTCDLKTEKWSFNKTQQAAIAFLLITFLLTLISILYDRFYYCAKRSINKFNFLIWFSPVRNIRKLITAESRDDELACVHGLRVLTMIWIIMGHSVNWNNLNSFRDTFTMRDRLAEMAPQPLYRGILTVDTFFFLSGLLTSYVTIKYTKGKYENFNTVVFVVLRYLRLTPQLCVFILFTILLPALFDGPIWKRYIRITDQCYTNWWINLTYLQNLIDVGNICGLHTWFLAADMQLHWISLVPMMILLKNRRAGILLARVLILVTLVISCGTIYVQKLPPGSVITSNNDFFDEHAMPKDYLRFVYKPWTHAYVFFIGFLFGDYIKENSKLLKQITLGKCTKYLLWLAALSGFSFSIYSTVPWLYGRPYDPVWSAILFPLNLLVWAAAMTLTIWLCVTNNAGILGRFLSSSIFRPFSRMTYGIYLTHVWVVWVNAGARRELIALNSHSIWLLFASVVVISFIVGFIFTILFETPVIYALDWVRKAIDKKNNNNQQNNAKYAESVKVDNENEFNLLHLKCHS